MKPEYLTRASTLKRVATFRVSKNIMYKFVSSRVTKSKGVGSFAKM